ncbi:hypothetical protein BJX96DRAFT_180590 [Aspergillus floccosus]
MRPAAATILFRTVEIRLDGASPERLNGRRLGPSYLISTLRQWSRVVRTIDLWGDEVAIEEELIGILPDFDNLEAFCVSYPPDVVNLQTILSHVATMPSVKRLSIDFLSPWTWAKNVQFQHLRVLHLDYIEHEPGICSLPDLPVLETLTLDFYCYCLTCPENAEGPRALLQLDNLPRLHFLSISGAHRGSVLFCGKSESLRRLQLSGSSGLGLLSFVSKSLNTSLEELLVADCDFSSEETGPFMACNNIQNVTLEDSISTLPLLSCLQVPATAHLSLQINPSDFEGFKNWERTLAFLRERRFSITLIGDKRLPARAAFPERLRQVVSLPNVTLEGPDWDSLKLADNQSNHAK